MIACGRSAAGTVSSVAVVVVVIASLVVRSPDSSAVSSDVASDVSPAVSSAVAAPVSSSDISPDDASVVSTVVVSADSSSSSLHAAATSAQATSTPASCLIFMVFLHIGRTSGSATGEPTCEPPLPRGSGCRARNGRPGSSGASTCVDMRPEPPLRDSAGISPDFARPCGRNCTPCGATPWGEFSIVAIGSPP